MKLLLLLTFGVMSTLTQPSQVLNDFSVGNTAFSAEVYTELLKVNSGNFLVCPLSVDIVLALVHAGAKGQTAQQLSAGLHLPESPQKIQEIFTHLTSTLKGNENDKLSSANKIYVKDGFQISDSFKSIAVSVFDAEIQNVDFRKKTQAASEINKWVEDKTHDKIKNLVKPADLTEDTRAILINAMFFQGRWLHEFEDSQTRKRPFRLNSKDHVEIDMMELTAGFNYYENPELNAKFLELPYLGHDVSMTIVLPNDVEGLGALEGHIADALAAPQYRYEQVHVLLPKLKIETTIKFKPVLQALGIKDAFERHADFSGISDNEDLLIDEVFQKAFIEVDEKGTTAAAATLVEMMAGAGLHVDPPKEFTADHPFLFYLKHRPSSSIMFVGRYVSNTN